MENHCHIQRSTNIFGIKAKQYNKNKKQQKTNGANIQKAQISQEI